MSKLIRLDEPEIDTLYENEVMDIDETPTTVIDNGASLQILDREFEHGDNGDSPFQSDWEHDLEQREQAQRGPKGEVLDDLDAMFHKKVLEEEDAKSVAPFATINPPSWDRGVLGGEVTILPNEAPKDVVYWPGDDRETIPITVSLQPLLPALVGGALDPSQGSGGAIVVSKPFAIVKWGTKNGQMQAEIDIGRGVEFTIAASSVYVLVGVDYSTAACTIRGAISFYAATRTQPACRTKYINGINTLAAGASVSIFRPDFASTINSFWRSNPLDQWLLQFFDGAGNLIHTRVVAPSTYLETPIVLPNDFSYVTVTNQSQNQGRARLVFGLF